MQDRGAQVVVVAELHAAIRSAMALVDARFPARLVQRVLRIAAAKLADRAHAEADQMRLAMRTEAKCIPVQAAAAACGQQRIIG